MGGGSLSKRSLSRAFTLIEILAVIVVIAIVALITVPLIVNVIDKSKKKALEDSAYGIIEAGRLYYMESIGEKDTFDRYDFEIKNKKFVLKEDDTKELKFTGTMPKTGMLQLHSNGNTAISICNDSYCACKSASELKVSIKDMNCKISSETGEVEDTESISEVKLKELEENMNTLKQEISDLKTENDDLNKKVVTLEKKKVATGTVISYMGNKVPEGYLACDGKTYNINDYKELANQIKEEFGKFHYFGGNGTSTFAVPNLQGEFLRGMGTNGHSNEGSGPNSAGVHKGGTIIPYITQRIDTSGSSAILFFGNIVSSPATDEAPNLLDAWNVVGNVMSKQAVFTSSSTNSTYVSASTPKNYTVRPTNTSVLYAIKY